MPLIELVGPAASGKSVLADACVTLGAHDARRSVLRPRRGLPGRVAPLARRSRVGLVRWLADRSLTGPSLEAVEQALASVSPDWQDYLQLLLEVPIGVSGPPKESALRLLERHWLVEALLLRAQLEATRLDPALHVLDEGLTHPRKILAACGHDEALIDRCASVVPLPDVLVVVDVEEGILVERSRTRLQESPARLRSLALGGPDSGPDDGRLVADIRRSMAVTDLVAGHARARGCRVVRLRTGGRSPEESAATLLAEVRDARA